MNPAASPSPRCAGWLLLSFLTASLAACRSEPPAGFEGIGWDPHTGRGEIVQRLPGGDLLRTCFHCGYRGYTGGLLIGSFNGPGYGLQLRSPQPGFPVVNLFCAQDESIWDVEEQVEYTYGWSENYGKGNDGIPLVFRRGEVVRADPGRVILRSENSAGCWEVTKVAYARADAPWWILATRIRNTSDRPRRFHFFSGDDPWIGTYRSSDGDVGWSAELGLIRRETVLAPGEFSASGMIDLGNTELGQQPGSFSNQADFVRFDPAVPLPDLALFANSFAHREAEVNPARPLDNRTLTAFNFGWRDRTLLPGEGFTVAWAMGWARSGPPGTTPRAPEIADEDWSVWRQQLEEGNPRSTAPFPEFAAEEVELTLRPGELAVHGVYHLRNRSESAMVTGIRYPILLAPERPPRSRSTAGGCR